MTWDVLHGADQRVEKISVQGKNEQQKRYNEYNATKDAKNGIWLSKD